jgi:hypothetical protein
MKNQHHYRNHQKYVNKPASDMERQKTQQPHDDENRSDYSEHLSLLFLLLRHVVRIAVRYRDNIGEPGTKAEFCVHPCTSKCLGKRS